MSKYQKGHFLQIPREGFSDGTYSQLSVGAMALLLWLKEYEHRYCTPENPIFFHTDKVIAEDMGISTKSVERYRKELIEAKIIVFKRKHFLYGNENKLSEKRVGSYIFAYDIMNKKK